MSSLPIGMFDSGVGGLGIMQEVMRRLPRENIIYLGDTLRLPYGNLDAETIVRYSLECSQFLYEQGIKLLIVACNTATSHAIEILKDRFDIPVIGVIEPTAKLAAFSTTNQRLGLLATQATVLSKAYEKSILALLPHSKVISVACPLFVPLVEEGFFSHPASRLIVREYLKSLDNQQIDTLVLGCTHYLYLSSIIGEEAGEGIDLIYSTRCCAEHAAQVLDEQNLHVALSHVPRHRFCVSGDPEKFRRTGEKLLSICIDHVEKIAFE